MRSSFITWALVPILATLLSLTTGIQAALAQSVPTGLEIKHESIQFARLGPPRRFGGLPAGVLYTPVGRTARTAVLFMHPEHGARNDWRARGLANRGFGALGFATRYANDDEHLISEDATS